MCQVLFKFFTDISSLVFTRALGVWFYGYFHITDEDFKDRVGE